jgi:hypothetical protein
VPTEEICLLCQVMPVIPGKKVCSTCWLLSPVWVRKSLRKGETVNWSRMLESDSVTPPNNNEEESHVH